MCKYGEGAVGYNSDTNLSEAEFGQNHAEMASKVAPQRLLAGDLRQASCKLLAHEPASVAQFLFALFGHIILENKFTGRDARDRDRTLDDRHDDLQKTSVLLASVYYVAAYLADRTLDGRLDRTLERLVCIQRRQCGINDHHG